MDDKDAVISRLDELCALYEQDLWKTRDELAAKDARIAELDALAQEYYNMWRGICDELSTARAEIEALRKQLEMHCDGWRLRLKECEERKEALRNRVGELEANNKASGAICDLA